MQSRLVTRRAFSRMGAALPLLAACGLSLRAGKTFAADTAGPDGIVQGAEFIHQEYRFKAEPGRVYAALTEQSRFDQVVRLSAAMQAGMPADAPTRISPEAGGAFSLFGGYISGRHIELLPGVRLVQAWRTASWPQGVFSIARFELSAHGGGTLLALDHTGFPQGQARSLAFGWNANYWQPLEKYLA
jgi:activator of HSP90 ATPase